MKEEATMKYPAATMRPADVPADVNTAYGLVKNLVFDQVHRFHRRYGGEFDELVSQANTAFVRGHTEFVSGKTNGGSPIRQPYAAKIRLWVWYSLFDAMRARIAKNDATESIGERDFELMQPEIFDFEEFTACLGDDATEVVRLLADMPRGIIAPAMRKGNTPRNYRSALREYLTDRGWTAQRISEAFAEIKATLK